MFPACVPGVLINNRKEMVVYMELTNENRMIEKEQRLKKIDKMMAEQGLDAVLFCSTAQPAFKVLVKYVTAAPLSTRRAFVFKEYGKEPDVFFQMAVDKKSYVNPSWIDIDNVHLGNMLPAVLGFIDRLPSPKPRIGWANLEEMPHGVYMTLTGSKAEFVDITKEFVKLRSNKSEYEIALTKLASDLAVGSFEEIIRTIGVGKTERELIGGAIGYLAQRGAEDLLILTQSKKPFAFIKAPKDVPVGETDIFVYSAEFAGPGGYWTQLIRPVFMDKKSHPDAYDVWQVALEAERAAAEVIRPGNLLCDIHNAIEAVIKKNGMEMSYWAGHGMGCDLGDDVVIGAEIKMEIEPNMVLTLQPSVESPTNSLLYGNTFLSVENGDPINLTGKYMDSPYYEDLYDIICG